MVDTKIGNIDIDQDFALGIKARYYFNNYIGIDVDWMYAPAKFPEQEITLNGQAGKQPDSNLDFYTLSLGPTFRYRGDGVWKRLNPYASIALTLLFGSASDVNTSPVYGQGGSSSIDGNGYNFRLGAQYDLNRFGIFSEYRYEDIGMEIDHFRSFSNGIDLTKTGYFLLIGGYFNF